MCFFSLRHKRRKEDFTRKSTLSFSNLLIMLLRKSTKSIKICINELSFLKILDKSVTACAFTQARQKLKHTAFIELDNDNKEYFYESAPLKTWKNYLLKATDGSHIRLPDNEEVEKEFGKIKMKNQYEEGKYHAALFVSTFDVLNKITVENRLEPSASYEANIALDMIQSMNDPRDLYIMDRGFLSYEFMANMIKNNKNFIIRCPKKTFKSVQPMFNGNGSWSQIKTIKVPSRKRENCSEKGFRSP